MDTKTRAWVEITTVIGCSMKCTYCPQPALKSAYSGTKVMNLESFVKYIETIPTDVEIHFAGYSEPWLAPDATLMVFHAYARGHPLVIHTTLKGMKLHEWDSIRHIPVSFSSIHLPDDKGLMKLSITDKYLKLLEQVITDGFNGRMEYRCMGELHRDIKHLFVGKDITYRNELLSRSNNLDTEKQLEVEGFTILKSSIEYGPVQCSRSPQLIQNVLLPNGDIQACCADYGLDLTFGNLNTQTYQQVLDGPQRAELLTAMKADKSNTICRYCESIEAIK